MKISFLIIVSIIFALFGFSPVYAATVCNGGRTYSYTTYTCTWSGPAGRYVCGSVPHTTSYTCGGSSCVGCQNCGETCRDGALGGGWCTYTYPCPGGTACGSGFMTTTDGCWTCDDSYTCPACPTNCGTNSRTCTNTCGGSYTDTSCACVPCCTGNACGQSDLCGGNCSNVDDGIPTAPTLTSANGTAASPTNYSSTNVPLSWTNTSGLTDYYQVVVVNSVGATIWPNTNTTATTVNPTGLVIGQVYHWQVRAVNSSCGTDYGTWSVWGYFRINSTPVINSITITNNIGTTVAVETGNRNQICQLAFADSTEPRRVRFFVNASDADGGTNIRTITLTWNGRSFPITLQAASGNNLVGTADITFDASYNDGGVYPLVGVVTDAYGATGTLSPRSFKIWDCEVPVGGNVFDGSPIIACPGTGFTNLASAEMNFTSLTYTQTNNGQVYNMSVTAPATYTDGGNNLIWGRTYNFAFNPDIAATGMNYRINGGNCSNLASTTFSQTVIDAYVAAPSAVMDFAWIRNQAGWYQTRGGGIEARNVISSAVPVTCLTPGCTPGLVMGGVGVSSDGLVAAQNINSSSGCAWGSGSGQCYRSYPRDTYVERNILSDVYSYETIKNSYWGRYGLGTTLTGDQSLENVLSALSGGTGVAFVQGDLNITANNVLPNENFLMVVVSGRIIVDPAVTAVAGVFVSNGDFVATGAVDNQLVISGIIYSLSDVSLTRAFNVGSDNNVTPAIVVNYRPDLMFSMPAALTRAISLRY